MRRQSAFAILIAAALVIAFALSPIAIATALPLPPAFFPDLSATMKTSPLRASHYATSPSVMQMARTPQMHAAEPRRLRINRPRHAVAMASAGLAAVLAAPAAGAATLPDYGSAPTGFYQLVLQDDRVFAAFGGTLEDPMANPVTHPAGTTPGAVFVLDADTLALRQEIPLHSIGGALALNPARRQLVVGHTHTHAISTVDLQTWQTRYHVLDTRLDGADYRMRYVATDSQGDIYVSAFDWRVPFRHAIFKFDNQGRRDPVFRSLPFDDFSISLLVTPLFSAEGREQILFGSAIIRLADAQTGDIAYVSPDPVRSNPDEQVNFYRFTPGPGGDTILATNHPHWMDGNQGDDNLYLFEKGREHAPQRLFTASTALEAAHDPAAGRLYATSYHDRLLSIVALPDGHALDQAEFENLRFAGGTPNGLAMRRTAHGTELFVTLRDGSHQIARVTIAPSVRGIDGLRAPGACTVQAWDLARRDVTPPAPCQFVDIDQQLRDNLAGAEAFAAAIPGQVASARVALQQAEAQLAQARQASAAAPQDAHAAAAAERAAFHAAMHAFMHEAFTRSARGAAHAVAGARRKLEAQAARAAR